MPTRVVRYVHQWTHPSSELVVHTCPVVHVGTPEYFTSISAACSSLNHVLVEGVRVPVRSDLGRYRRLAAKSGLVTQSELSLPQDLPKTNVDIHDNDALETEFPTRRHWLKLVLQYYLLVLAVPPDRLRELVALSLAYTEAAGYKAIDPEVHWQFTHTHKPPIDLFIQNTRDAVIAANVERLLDENLGRDYRYDIGVLVGGAHMAAIYRVLKTKGFKWKLEKTLTVM
jgi:hypothetical protein